jgi:putative endopeptidase
MHGDGSFEEDMRCRPLLPDGGFGVMMQRQAARPSQRRVAAFAAGGVLMAALLLVAASGDRWGAPARAALGTWMVSDTLNEKFLEAADEGDFLQRLNELWFVESNAGRQDVAGSATELAASIQIAGFPEDMQANIDVTVNPCDDFYEFACGKFDDEHRDKISDYKSSVSFAWDKAEQTIRNQEIEILKTDPGPAGTIFRSCMDEDAIEKLGDRPIQPWLKYIDAIHDKDSLVTACSELSKHDMDNFFGWWISQDPHDSQTKVFFLAQTGYSLPERTYYLEDSPEMIKHRETLVSVATKFYAKVGYSDEEAFKRAKSILEFETKVAKIADDKEKCRKDHGKPTDWAKVQELMPYWPWKSWLTQLSTCTSPPDGAAKVCTEDHPALAAVGEPGEIQLYMMNEDFFPKMNKLLEETDFDTIKAIMSWQVMRNAAIYMSAEYIDLMVELNADLFGMKAKNPRLRKCYYSASGITPWPMSKLYIDKIFHKPNRDAALAMLEEVKTQFMAALPSEEWMTEEDRLAAEHKLSEMFFQVAYPTNAKDEPAWPPETHDMDGLVGPNFFVNYMLAQRLAVERDFKKIHDKPKRREWSSSSITVNAFYGPSSNGLWIPAGILQSPFFDADNGDARNYGSLGMVLGHEMTHGFDDNGRQYDARGELHDWWHQASIAQFSSKSQCIGDVFSKFSIDGRHVNGNYTMGEDIADSGGLKFSYAAFLSKKRTAQEKRIYFTSFAQTWCQVERKQAAISSVLTVSCSQ